ncbi:MAG: DUF1254 domain-containing protein, partial [Ardenticatenia bacterium]|nr:DUF1254 domain-containing protein [Ardenticatenia bacterium]
MSNVTPQEAQQIAAEAYIFAYPMLMAYRASYLGALDESSPFFRAPPNQIVHDTRPADHTREDVVTMNGDTPYSNFGLDLRAEPRVASAPDVPGRYYVMQFADWYTHNSAYIGTRTTGNKAGHYLFVGPKWEGEIPAGKFDEVFECETDMVVAIVRTQLLGSDDLPNVLAIQGGYEVTPLSVFLGEEPKASPLVDWLPWNPAIMNSIDFIEYINFLLTFCEPIHPDDQPAMERFARIGIAPGKEFDASKLDPAIREAMQEGVDQASQKLSQKSKNIARQVNGWNM